MNKHNQEWSIKIAGFMKEALQCCEGTIRYFKIELKENRITKLKDGRLLKRYFTELEND